MLRTLLLIGAVLTAATPSHAYDSSRSGSYPGSSLRQTERTRDSDGNTTGFIDRARDGSAILRDSNRSRIGSTDREQGRTVVRDRSGFTRGCVGR